MMDMSFPEEMITSVGTKPNCGEWLDNSGCSIRKEIRQVKTQLLENSQISWILLHLEAGRKVLPLPAEETLLKFEFERFVEVLEHRQVCPDTIFQWDEILGRILIPKKEIEVQKEGG